MYAQSRDCTTMGTMQYVKGPEQAAQGRLARYKRTPFLPREQIALFYRIISAAQIDKLQERATAFKAKLFPQSPHRRGLLIRRSSQIPIIAMENLTGVMLAWRIPARLFPRVRSRQSPRLDLTALTGILRSLAAFREKWSFTEYKRWQCGR